MSFRRFLFVAGAALELAGVVTAELRGAGVSLAPRYRIRGTVRPRRPFVAPGRPIAGAPASAAAAAAPPASAPPPGAGASPSPPSEDKRFQLLEVD